MGLKQADIFSRHYEWLICDEYVEKNEFIMATLTHYVGSKYYLDAEYKRGKTYSVSGINPDKIRRFSDD